MRIYKLILIIILGSVFSITCKAQPDSNYIKRYLPKISLKAYISKNMLALDQEISSKKSLGFKPNNPVNLGLGFAWKNTVLSLSYGYAFDFLRDRNRGKTKSLDLQLHYYGRRFVGDLFLQKYKGFYLEDNMEKSEKLCPDLSLSKYGIYGEYIFNHSRFSYKAAFNASEQQIRSAGSVLVGTGMYFTEITSDSSFMLNDKNSMQNFQFGFSAGYAYSWVFRSHWFITASATAGVHLGSDKIKNFGKNKIRFFPTAFPRIAFGYHHDSWSMTLKSIWQLQGLYNEKNIDIILISGNFQVVFTQRIHTLSFKRK